jgi:hypothetical protein
MSPLGGRCAAPSNLSGASETRPEKILGQASGKKEDMNIMTAR